MMKIMVKNFKNIVFNSYPHETDLNNLLREKYYPTVVNNLQNHTTACESTHYSLLYLLLILLYFNF